VTGGGGRADSPAEGAKTLQAGIRVTADYFHGRIDVRRFRAENPQYTVLASEPLLLEPREGTYAALVKFGGLVCWNCPDELREELRRAVAALPGSHARSSEVEDSVDVVTDQPQDLVEFDRITIRKLTIENLKVISTALAQSVALEYFENRVRESLNQSEPIVVRLREEGRLRQREREVIQAVGFALEVRSAVLAKLTVFDSLPEAWESAAIAKLVSLLHQHFDLEERLAAIKEKVDYLTDLNSTLLDLLSNRKSRRLEWIIIILIALEIVIFFVTELLAHPPF
jgi:uncharacterized Rmd1/YagE family protein